ncbi:SecDF P1 head subdomain-containing protein [Kordia sp.]|uniref:SecDF P1 head subdomain-containing protein n=1 Tax=Kordia sp. TaxID=1965332 RepID=UPI003D6BBF13
MRKKHLNYSLALVLFLIGTIACEKPPKPPTTNIQLKIIDTNISEGEKKRGIANIQKRLESVGAKNIIITEQKNQKVTFNYEGNIKPQTFEKAFSLTGKLEFFEVCKEREILYEYLLKTYGGQVEDGLSAASVEEIKSIDDVLGIKITGRYNDPFFALVPNENVEKVTKILLQKEPFFVSEIERKVKFLLGKNSYNGNYELCAVYVTSENKAPIDGSYVIDATVTESNYNDSYLITIQKNEEGAKIWEQMTEHVHQTNGNIAVVVDDVVYSAPSVMSGKISGGRSEISSNLNRKEAAILASAIRSGSIPEMEIIKIEFVQETTSKK